MFGRKKEKETSQGSRLSGNRTRLLHSRVKHALIQDHEHYFDWRDTQKYLRRRKLKCDTDPRCKVCGIKLSELRASFRFEAMNKMKHATVDSNLNEHS